ncbi:hypothetical protein [Acinetobacter sp.]|uniref:hypothetical protein n=1 Tax=Acinetobacter sp. TaxID=472 RepID=UPI0031D37B0F
MNTQKSRVYCPQNREHLSAIWKAKNKGQQRAAIWNFLKTVDPSPYVNDFGSNQSEVQAAVSVIWAYSYVKPSRRLSKIQVWGLVHTYLEWKQAQITNKAMETGPEETSTSLDVHYGNKGDRHSTQ